MEVADSLLELVGNTPMVRLGRVGAGLACDLVAKVELFNPGGSVKDRPAVAMIDAAEPHHRGVAHQVEQAVGDLHMLTVVAERA